MNAISHGDRWVHLNTAGLGRMPAPARAVLLEWTRHEDRHGPHELEEHLHDEVRHELDDRLAALLGTPPGDTVLFTSAADAFATVLSRLPLGPRDRIWTTPYEGAANLTTLFALRDRARCGLDVVPLRPDGDLDLEWMAAHIDDDVALVSVAYVPAGCGIVNPVEEVGRILAPYRSLYAVDASYAVGQLPVDAARIGCDLLTGDGWRFLRGPESVGFAYAAPKLRQALAPHRVAPLVAPHGAAVAALNTALAHPAPAAAHRDLAPGLRAAVEEVPGTELIAPGRTQSGMLTFRHAGLPAALIRRRLAERGVVVWKTVGQETPLFLPGRGVTTAVRACVHGDNAAQDVDRFAEALREVVHDAARAAAVRHETAAAPAAHALSGVPAASRGGLRAVASVPGQAGPAPAPAPARAGAGDAGAGGAGAGGAGAGGAGRRPAGRHHLTLVPAP
ncbi:aminotransferase class V-fold PLP-dependent enzyme [Streptomyces sp. NPDC021356]|uniref:aminotransferase class V-fold PLP-dependent enzyme n=1 Tax=Streptomyces sp. NPDC021356 TaxID=3154900 RepID=UPI0033C02A30